MKKHVLLAVSCLLLSFSPTGQKAPQKIVAQEKATQCFHYEGEESSPAVVPLDCERKNLGDSAEFSFQILKEVDDVKGDGTAFLSATRFAGNKVYFRISGLKNDAYIELHFSFQGKEVAHEIICFAGFTNNICSSAESMETARTEAGLDIGYEEEDDSETDSDLKDGEEALTSDSSIKSIGATGKVSGVLEWKDQQGNAHPLCGAKVVLSIGGAQWKKSCYTDSTGYYSMSYAKIWYVGNGLPKIQIYPQSALVSVALTDGKADYYSHTFSHGYDNTFSYTFSPIVDGQLGQAMMLFQGAHLFAIEAEKLNGGNPLPKCSVLYNADNDKDNAFYQPDKKQIRIYGPTRLSLQPNTYATWDVLGHEYGHHIENCLELGNYVVGSHSVYASDYDTVINRSTGQKPSQTTKKNAMELAWFESWPTYWSTVAQKSFPEEYRNIMTVDDEFYSDCGFEYSLDWYYDSAVGGKSEHLVPGDAGEWAIQCILYKLYSPTTDAYDHFALGEDVLWQVVKRHKPRSLSDFVNALYSENVCDKSKLGELLEAYQISPKLSIAQGTSAYDVTLNWNNNIGSRYFQLNEFDVCMSVDGGATVLRKETVTIPEGEHNGQFKVPQSWFYRPIKNVGSSNSISSVPTPGVFYLSASFYLVSRQTDFFVSGNYYSGVVEWKAPGMFSN